MALKYVVKKTTFGFDKEKAEKYVERYFASSLSCAHQSLLGWQ